ncbi:cubilin-like [Mytilus californianus]|uniref:cubilin-like n=1 Tax=Mytilus californianus TaxID=6549 RepID=UPI0022484E38|nr:cubilin-like [Mytilus californianus]XP_052100243.1 cubilin-like [Mytilus californianus]XP_052100244.1 cubilin-like [Mytilus californianus]XP_052100245.1 cubilin-like [Mytilus californianus]
MRILFADYTVIIAEFIIAYILRNIVFVEGQTCSVVERNFTASTIEMISLTSPGYNGGTGTYENDMDCWWIIDSGSDDLQLLIFLTYDISCPGDTIALYNAEDQTSTLFSSCGAPSSPVHYSTSQRYLRVEMHTDSATVKSGFKLDYLAAKNYEGTGCQNREDIILTENFQFLSSPSFPETYPSKSDCRWNLAYEFGAIEINVILGDIEDGTSCDYDKYQIYDGEHRCDYNRMSVVCNEYPDTIPYNYTSNSTSVVVAFESDGSVNRRGFLLRYRGIPNPTTTTMTSSNTTESNSKDFVITAEILLGLVFGSLGLISFTVITTVCIVMKLRVPLEKTISTTPIKSVKSKPTIQTISRYNNNTHTKPAIMNNKAVTNGVSRRIVAW